MEAAPGLRGGGLPGKLGRLAAGFGGRVTVAISIWPKGAPVRSENG